MQRTGGQRHGSPPSSPLFSGPRELFHDPRDGWVPCLARTFCGRGSLRLLLAVITAVLWSYVLVYFEGSKGGLEGAVLVAQHDTSVSRFRGDLPAAAASGAGGSGAAAGGSSGGGGGGGGSCASVAPAYVEARLKGAVARRTRPCHQTHVGGSPFTTSTILRVHPCVRAFGGGGAGSSRVSAATLHMRDVLFIVMSGLKEIERLYAVRETWGSLVPNVLAIGEANHSASGMVTLDELAGKHSYSDAQHRSLLGLRHGTTHSAYRHCSWVVLVDDDTYVNVHELPGFLVGWDPRLPLLFGHIWYGPEMRGKDEGAWPSGGAGIILSRRAAEMLSAALYTPTCPFLGLNDVTLGHCATRLGIPMIHSPVFDPEGNVFVPGYKEVKRKIRKDGSFMRPPNQYTDLWLPSFERERSHLGWSEAEGLDQDGNPIPEEALWAKYGREHEWADGVEYVVVRPPLVEVFKDRTSVEAVLFIHRATPAWMRDLHANVTATVRDWLALDTELARLGLDTLEEALVKTGARGPYSAEDLAVMESTTSVVDKSVMGL